MTDNEKNTNYETLIHIQYVRECLDKIIIELLKRGEEHDRTKLQSPEVESFTEWTPKLAGSTYGSPEYQNFLKEMKPALDHHYSKNRHHPEHFKKGIKGMNIVDLVEMLCDWKAATLRHANGDVRRSLKLNKNRFSMDDQLYAILKNSVKLFRGII
jgi:hypothetical protein